MRGKITRSRILEQSTSGGTLFPHHSHSQSRNNLRKQLHRGKLNAGLGGVKRRGYKRSVLLRQSIASMAKARPGYIKHPIISLSLSHISPSSLAPSLVSSLFSSLTRQLLSLCGRMETANKAAEPKVPITHQALARCGVVEEHDEPRCNHSHCLSFSLITSSPHL